MHSGFRCVSVARRLDHFRGDDGPAVHEVYPVGLHGGGSDFVARGRYVPGSERLESGITRTRQPQPPLSRGDAADWCLTVDALHPVREILETWRLETHPAVGRRPERVAG